MPTASTKPPTIPPRIRAAAAGPAGRPAHRLAGRLFFPPINHDVAAIIDVSARWIGGEKLCVEIIDENLPLTFIVHALPVLTAKILPGPHLLVHGLGGGRHFASFWACRRLVRLVPSADHALTEALLPPVLLFLFTVLPNEHFGQRELHHVRRLRAVHGRRVDGARRRCVPLTRLAAIAIGLVAGVALAMKPHYLAIPRRSSSTCWSAGAGARRSPIRSPGRSGLVAVAHSIADAATIFADFGRFVMPLAIEAYAPIGDAGWRPC